MPNRYRDFRDHPGSPARQGVVRGRHGARQRILYRQDAGIRRALLDREHHGVEAPTRNCFGLGHQLVDGLLAESAQLALEAYSHA